MNISLNLQALTEKKKENLVTAIYVGSIFIVLAAVYFINLPNSLFDDAVNFFGAFKLAQVPGVSFSLPAPAVPAAHIALYVAVFQVTLGLGILEIGVLALRIHLRSPVARKAETVGNLVFWLGASFLMIAYLVRDDDYDGVVCVLGWHNFAWRHIACLYVRLCF